MLIRAYKTHARPLLGYRSPVWSPYSIDNILVLRSFMRKVITCLP